MTMVPEVVNQDLARPGAAAQAQVAIRRVCNDDDLMPGPVCDAATAIARLDELKAFISKVMVLDVDYGKIPGTPKETLYKSGAEKLLEVYGYSYEANVTERIEDWTGKMFGGQPFFHYEVAVDVYSKRSGALVGRGLGSCNSREARYRWRLSQLKCPSCGEESIIKSKFGTPSWYCMPKKGGCGAKFGIDEPAIAEQTPGRIENDDVATLCNTILKMAKKRGVVDAALGVTRSSALFVPEEDAEDDDHGGRKNGNKDKDKGRHQDDADHEGRIRVPFRGKDLWTKGITAGTLLRLRPLADEIEKREAGSFAKTWLEQYKAESDIDLTDEQGKALLESLQKALANQTAGDRKPGATGEQQDWTK